MPATFRLPPGGVSRLSSRSDAIAAAPPQRRRYGRPIEAKNTALIGACCMRSRSARLIRWRDWGLRGAAMVDWPPAPQCQALVQLIAEPLLQLIYDLASPRLAFGRVALIGDAAPKRRMPPRRVKPPAMRQCFSRARRRDVAAPGCYGRALVEQPHHRARAPSRRVSASSAERRGAYALGAARHSASGARRNCSSGFFARVTADISRPVIALATSRTAARRVEQESPRVASPARSAPPADLAREPTRAAPHARRR